MQISPKLRNRKRSLRRVILPKDAIECVFLKQKYALKHLGTCKMANSFCFGLAGNLYVFNRRFQASFSLFFIFSKKLTVKKCSMMTRFEPGFPYH